jgi:hypothetical protein
MSQWSNRYSVLEEVNDSLLSTPSPNVLTSTEDSQTISPFPKDKVYIMSNFVRYSTYIPVLMKTLDTGAKVETSALLDCGATGLFLTPSLWNITISTPGSFQGPSQSTMWMALTMKLALSKKRLM